MKAKKILKLALSTAVAASLNSNIAVAGADKGKSKPDIVMEKCYGIAKTGKNDCGTAAHACSAQSQKDNDPAEWLYLPVGTCDKIMGGSKQAVKKEG